MTHNPVGAGWQPWKDIDFHYVYWWTHFLSCLSLYLPWQPESEAEVGAGGEGTSGAAVKRGLSLEAAAAAAAATGQDVKRFRTATGAASTVSSVDQYSSYLLSAGCPCVPPYSQRNVYICLKQKLPTEDASMVVVVLIYCSLQQHSSLTSISSGIPLWSVVSAVSKLDEVSLFCLFNI